MRPVDGTDVELYGKSNLSFCPVCVTYSIFLLGLLFTGGVTCTLTLQSVSIHAARRKIECVTECVMIVCSSK